MTSINYKEEAINLALHVGFSTMGTFLFTSIHPIAGVVFGAAHYSSKKVIDMAIEKFPTLKQFSQKNPLLKDIITNVVAVLPAMVVSLVILGLCGMAITGGGLLAIAIASAVTFGLFLGAKKVLEHYGVIDKIKAHFA